jgi:GGDEF domain-containing protein
VARAQWVVILEADARAPDGMLDEFGLRRLLEALPNVCPVGLHSPERYALQVQVVAHGEAEALGLAVAHWRAALEKLGIRNSRLIRAEVLTQEEFQRDCDLAYTGEVIAEDKAVEVHSAGADSVGDRLLWRAFHDPLTQLPGLGLFLNHLDQALGRPGGAAGHPGVLILKLTGFDAVKERWGRSVADDVLVSCVRRLGAALPREVTMALLSPNEIAVLIEGSPETGRTLAVTALEALADPIGIGDVRVWVSASAGIAHGRTGQGAEEVLAEARSALEAGGTP